MKIEIINRDEKGTGWRVSSKVFAQTDYVLAKFIELNDAYPVHLRPLKFIDIGHEKTNDYTEFTITSYLSVDEVIKELYKRIIENKVTHITIFNSPEIYEDNKFHVFIKCQKQVLEVVRYFDEVDKFIRYGSRYYN